MTTDRTSNDAQRCGLSRLKRRQFLELAGVAGAAFPCIRRALGAGISRPVLSIGLTADPQYADKNPAGTRFYRQSIRKLESVVSHFNRLELAFCVNLGDLIDGEWRNYDAILETLAASRHRFHHVLGNHDFEVSSDLKARVPARLGLARRFYAIERAGWCFAMLDTTDVSLYAHPESTPEHAEAATALKRLADAGAANAQTWNSALSGRQLQWLDAVSKAAANEGRRVIVFAHHPVHPDDAHTVWNASDVLDVLDRNRNIVAWFNGHNHAGAFAVRNGVPFVTIEGMVETRDANAYAVLNLYAKHFELVGHGRQTSRTAPFGPDVS